MIIIRGECRRGPRAEQAVASKMPRGICLPCNFEADDEQTARKRRILLRTTLARGDTAIDVSSLSHDEKLKLILEIMVARTAAR